MIRLTRLNGSVFSLNPDLIHRAEETPDTVLTLIDGSRYLVVEPLEEVIGLVVDYRARVIAQAGLLGEAGPRHDLVRDQDHRHLPDLGLDPGPDPDEEDQDQHQDGEPGHAGVPSTGASVVRLRSRRA